MIKLAIVDDNRSTLQSLRELLSYEKGIELIFTAKSGKDFLNKMENLDHNNGPEVVLMDLDMAEMSGIETIAIGKLKYPEIKFIILTVFDDEDALFDSIKAGASGYLLKDEKISVIVEHLFNLTKWGFTPMSPAIAKKTFDLLYKIPLDKENKPDNHVLTESLSDRETEVLQHLIKGANYKTIAEILHISVNTVKKHIAHIYEKMHVSSRFEVMKLLGKL